MTNNNSLQPVDVTGVELLPCPFCGPGQSCVDLYFDDTAYRYRVRCGRCGCSTGTSPRNSTPTPAITAWNTRATQPATTPNEHVDAVVSNGPLEGSIYCKVCGLMRPHDGWKKLCSGRTPEISLHATQPDITERARQGVDKWYDKTETFRAYSLTEEDLQELAEMIAAEFTKRG